MNSAISIAFRRLYHDFFPNEFLKLCALDQLSGADKQDKGAIWLFEHRIDLIDPNVAVFRCLADRQRQLPIDWDRFAQFPGRTVRRIGILVDDISHLLL